MHTVEQNLYFVNLETCWTYILSFSAGTSPISVDKEKEDVLKALSQIIDPDFGTDIVSCGFVKDLQIDESSKEVIMGLP